jgi:hypothetical protein
MYCAYVQLNLSGLMLWTPTDDLLLCRGVEAGLDLATVASVLVRPGCAARATRPRLTRPGYAARRGHVPTDDL